MIDNLLWIEIDYYKCLDISDVVMFYVDLCAVKLLVVEILGLEEIRSHGIGMQLIRSYASYGKSVHRICIIEYLIFDFELLHSVAIRNACISPYVCINRGFIG